MPKRRERHQWDPRALSCRGIVLFRMLQPYPLREPLSKGDGSFDHISSNNRIATLHLSISRPAQGRIYSKHLAQITIIVASNVAAQIHFAKMCPQTGQSQGQGFHRDSPNKGKKPTVQVRQGRINFTNLAELLEGAPVMTGTFSITNPLLFYLILVHLIVLLAQNLELRLA